MVALRFRRRLQDALIYAHPETRKIEPTKRLWTMGNFSRFIRPGAIRVAAETDADLKVSAYLSGDGQRIAVVLINNGEARPARLESSAGAFASAEAWTTSAEHDLAPIEASAARVDLPARSITTVVVPAKAGF